MSRTKHAIERGHSCERHLPLVSAERLGCLFVGLACHVQRRVPVPELVRPATSRLYVMERFLPAEQAEQRRFFPAWSAWRV